MAAPARRTNDKTPAAPRGAGLAPWLALALVLAATIGVYARVSSFGFIAHYDDEVYVTANPHVTGGLTGANVAAAFTEPVAGNWHPLTMLSHLLDVQLFGLDGGRHHVTSLLLHLVATVLLFVLLRSATRRAWPSVFVAGVFALHPMHVESVAWIAERKDVLSAVFAMLALLAYVRARRERSVAHAVLAGVALACGLMAKPMLVTLPLVFVLFDSWPLGEAPARNTAKGAPREGVPARVFAQWPYLLLVVADIAITLATQRGIGAMADAAGRPWGMRVANALAAYGTYAWKFLVPVRLAAFYPYPPAPPVLAALVSFAALAAVTGAAIALRRTAPYVLFGWLWFLGMLVPVIGLVQVGSQAMADRYTYLPHVGLAIIVAWGAADLARRARVPAPALGAAAVAALAALLPPAWAQVGTWRDTASVFGHAVAVTGPNEIAEVNLGAACLDAKDVAGALAHFGRAVAADPAYAAASYNLGIALQQAGRLDDAGRAFARAAELDPGDWRAEYRFAVVLAQQGRFEDAGAHFAAANRIAPSETVVAESWSRTLSNQGAQFGAAGRAAEAAACFEKALALAPGNEDAKRNLEIARRSLPAKR